MKIGVIENNVCINVVEAENIEVIKSMKCFEEFILAECPIEYGINDTYLNGAWALQKMELTELDKIKAELEVTQSVIDEMMLGGVE